MVGGKNGEEKAAKAPHNCDIDYTKLKIEHVIYNSITRSIQRMNHFIEMIFKQELAR